MKKLMVLLLSFCLFHLQVGIAFGDDTPPAEDQEVSLINEQIDQDEDGKLTVKEEQEKVSAEASAMMLTSLTVVATAAIAPLYVKFCRTYPSAWIYAATAAIYVGAEIVTWSKYKKASEKTMTAYNNSESKKQSDALKAAAEQTKAAAKSAKQKALHTNLATMGYTAAAVTSLFEGWPWNTIDGACVTASNDPSPTFENFDFKSHRMIAGSIERTNSELNSAVLFDELIRIVNGEKSSPSLRDYNSRKQIYSTSRSLGIKSGILLAVNQMSKMIYNDAQADDQVLSKVGVSLGLAGALGFSIWLSTITTAKFGLLPVMANSKTRSAIFAASAAFNAAAGVIIGKTEKKLNERADQFNLLAGELDKLTALGTVTTDATGGSEVSNGDATIPTSQDQGFANDGTDLCFISGKNNEPVADPTCSCAKTNTCKISMIPNTKFNGFKPPPVYNQALEALKATGNSLYSGDYEGATAHAQEAAGHGAMIGKLFKDLKDETNKKLKKKGHKAIPFDKLQKKYAKAFKRGVAKSLSNMSPSDAKALMAFAAGPAGSEIDVDAKGDQSKINVVAAKKDNTGAGAKKAKADPFAGMNFDMDDQPTAADSSAEVAKDYDYRKTEGNQISTKADVSIFNLITVRYMKTAFPVLFSEDAAKE